MKPLWDYFQVLECFWGEYGVILGYFEVILIRVFKCFGDVSGVVMGWLLSHFELILGCIGRRWCWCFSIVIFGVFLESFQRHLGVSTGHIRVYLGLF